MLPRSSRLTAMISAVIIGLAIATRPVYADGVDNEGPFTLLTGRLGRGDDEALFLWDKIERKLAVYSISPTAMELLFVRNCKFDFEADINSRKMTPTPEEIAKLVRRGETEDKEKKEAGEKAAKKKPAESGERRDGSDRSDNSGPPAPEASPGRGWSLMLGKFQGGSADALYIWSHEKKRLAVYTIRGDTLELLFSRNCAHDFRIGRSLGRMTPRVRDLEKRLGERGHKEEETKVRDQRSESPANGRPRR